ncbi:DUF6415 family natural product biosynthesis protein [Streptomyces ossamyceticus]|nr:DUF6415 family natural product biosynthesis protein [Streptomyces ossamyceticus]
MTARAACDPRGAIYARLPLDRETHALLAKVVLVLDVSADLPPDDCAQIALQLTGHANAVAHDVRRLCNRLRKGSPARTLTEAVLVDTARRLEGPAESTVAAIQDRARVVRELYERLDSLTGRSRALVASEYSRAPS